MSNCKNGACEYTPILNREAVHVTEEQRKHALAWMQTVKQFCVENGRPDLVEIWQKEIEKCEAEPI